MFGRFRQWRRQRKRQLFQYWDGQRHRHIDPLVPLFRMGAYPGYRQDLHPGLVEQGDPEAIEFTVGMIQSLFDVQEYNPDTGSGLTKAELLNLLLSFLNYTERLKKNTDVSLTPPVSTGATSTASRSPTTSDTSAAIS